MDSQQLLIYDLYVMNNAGMPIFAGCTNSDYCEAHLNQHPLHTGFISALQNFGREVFSGDFTNMKFPDVKLNLKSVGDYSIVFVNPINVPDDLIQKKLNEVADLFRKKYQNQIKSYMYTDEQFEDFVSDAIALGLVPSNRLQSSISYFVDEDQNEQSASKNLKEKIHNASKK